MLRADLFVISTGVEKVALNFNKPDQRFSGADDADRSRSSTWRRAFRAGQYAAQDRGGGRVRADGRAAGRSSPIRRTWRGRCAAKPARASSPDSVMSTQPRAGKLRLSFLPPCQRRVDAARSTQQDDVIYRDHVVTAFIGLYWWPNNPGHVIIVPNRHIENIYDLTPFPASLRPRTGASGCDCLQGSLRRRWDIDAPAQ